MFKLTFKVVKFQVNQIESKLPLVHIEQKKAILSGSMEPKVSLFVHKLCHMC